MVRDGAAADGPRSDAGLADSVALDASPADGTVADGAVTFVLQAKAFVDGGKIPATPFTCKGSSYPAGSSPALSWSGAPIGTQSFALIMDDLTASNWTHWVYYRIPASASALPAGDNTSGTLGKEQQGQTRYAGPCPPSGVHTYRFRLFALSGTLSKLAAGATRAQLETAMAQQILAVATLTGTVAKADL
ncbi:MAG: YbhB/YbcL family Raf kinase inhibitor-like protein [Deltaproteobacteria bacterium]|nr:YbhB/YbcL family Raf kinase inhibitor-like protein [Deltaproteobacteria bacterium]